MDVRILDLDGSLAAQPRLVHGRGMIAAGDWGPRVRMACGFRRFRRFEAALADRLGREHDGSPQMTFIGSGDFHHVSLALVRRLREPFNLLVIDKHPDWMCGVPFLHCGTWLRHASLLPLARRVFHVGGDLDFDNSYGWMAPWRQLRDGRIAVLPAIRRFRGRAWAGVPHQALRPSPAEPTNRGRIEELLRPFRADLARHPLYVSLDKDVLRAEEAVVNWDSGYLTTAEVDHVLDVFSAAARGRLAGMDVVGDWSPVRVRSALGALFHLTEHPRLSIDSDHATQVNESLNLRLIARTAQAAVPLAG